MRRVGSQQSASVRQSFQPRYNRIRRLVDGILRKMSLIQKPAHLVERGRRVCTDAVENSLAKVLVFARLAA